MQNMESNESRTVIPETLCLLAGISLAFLLLGGTETFTSFMLALYENVGITIVALVPLAVWAIDLVMHGSLKERTLAHIGAQAKEVGFIGTLLGMSLMLSSLVLSFQGTDGEGIRQASVGIAQALNSTLVGCVIAAICRESRHRARMKARSQETLS